MGITLGGYAFGESITAVREHLKERGGRDARVVLLKGVLEGLASLDAIEAELDAIAAAASDTEEAVLTLRPGRVLVVRRTALARQVYRDALSATFELELEAADAFERAAEETEVAGVFTGGQLTLDIPASGNTPALPRIGLTPDSSAVRPSVGVGDRVLTYDGTVAAGSTLVVDAAAGVALLDGVDVTPYTDGLPPLLSPGDNTLVYADESVSTPDVAVSVAFHARWW
jgi:hypothetical protein